MKIKASRGERHVAVLQSAHLPVSTAGVGTFTLACGLPRFQRAGPSTSLDESYSIVIRIFARVYHTGQRLSNFPFLRVMNIEISDKKT